MMTTNPVLLKLTEQATFRQPESYVKQSVRHEVQRNAKKVAEDRTRWFQNYTLPKASVLARLPFYDRDALIAHFRAKELREIADARHTNNDYRLNLALKRLGRVNEIAKAFAEIKGKMPYVA